MKYLKLVIVNMAILLFFILIILVSFQFLSVKFKGLPLYHNNFYQINKIDLISFYKNKAIKKQQKEFISIFTKQYPHNDFSGPYVNLKCGKVESGENNLVYKSDTKGFRENTENLYKSSDYVFLGDSFVHGICINYPNNMVSVIRELSNKKILNLSLHGLQPYQQLAYANVYLKDVNYKELVLFFFEGNDYEQPLKQNLDNYQEIIKSNKKILEKKTFYNLKQNIFLTLGEIDKNIYKVTSDKINLITKMQIYFSEILRFPVSILKYLKRYPDLLDKEDFKNILTELKNLTNEKEAKLSIVYLPHFTRLSMLKYENHPQIMQFNKMRDTIQNLSNDLSIHFLDFADYIEKRKDPLDIFYYNINTHYNETGNRLLAQFIYEELMLKKIEVNN